MNNLLNAALIIFNYNFSLTQKAVQFLNMKIWWHVDQLLNNCSLDVIYVEVASLGGWLQNVPHSIV